jgi:tripartite ATP-independent transporter DctM subunit
MREKRGVINVIVFVLFVILMCLNVPIVFSLLVPGIAAFAIYPDLPIQLIGPRMAHSFLSSSQLAVPLFIFAAQILTDIEITDVIFGFVNKCVGHVRGGLAQVNVLASVVFAGMSGSSTADAAGLGKVEIKAMTDQGYSPAFAGAVTAASSIIGPIIPPSIPAIVYGSLAEISIGKLLIGGFFPGVILAVVQMVQIGLIAKRRGFLKTKFAGFGEIYKYFKKSFLGLLAPVILVGGMLSGFFTPTEAAAVAVAYAIVIGFFLKSLTFSKLWQSFKKAAYDTGAILIMFTGATLIALIVTRLHGADSIINFMTGFTTSPAMLLFVVNIFLLIVGCFMGPLSAIILLTPILVPLAKSYGINEIHFGILIILNLMIGQITPPMGGILFVISKVAEVKLGTLLKETWPFIIGLVITLFIVTYVPQTVTWFPSLFIK